MLSNLEEIGKRIKEAREEIGMKQQVLAFKANMDVASLSRYENGKQTPNLESFVALAQSLNVSTDYLLFGGSKEQIFNKDKNDDNIIWSEVSCYALATLIETGILSVEQNIHQEGIALSLRKNPELLEFFDKFAKLGELSDSLNDEQYETAKLKIINDYKYRIMNLDQKLIEAYHYHDFSLIRENEDKCERLMKQIVKNHAKIVK